MNRIIARLRAAWRALRGNAPGAVYAHSLDSRAVEGMCDEIGREMRRQARLRYGAGVSPYDLQRRAPSTTGRDPYGR